MQLLFPQMVLILFSLSFSKKLIHISNKTLTREIYCKKYFKNIAFDKPKNGKISVYCAIEWFIFPSPVYAQIDIDKDKIIEAKELSTYVEIYKHLTNDMDLYVQYNESFGGYTAVFQKDNYYKEIFIYNLSESGNHEFKDITINKESFVLLGGRPLTYSKDGKADYFLLMSKYPYNSVYKLVNINIRYISFEKYKLISLKDGFIAFFKNTKDYIFIFLIYDLDLNYINMKNITYSFEEEIMDIKISKLSDIEYLNEFITCFLYKNKSICYLTKYENSDLTFSEKYEICSCEQTSKEKSKYLLLYIFLFIQNENNKILFICSNNALLKNEYNYTFILSNYENGIIQYENTHSFVEQPLYLNEELSCLFMNKKGLVMLHFFMGIKEYYLSSNCNSTIIYLNANEIKEFNLEYLIYEGIYDLSFSFSYIDDHLQIFKNDYRVKEEEVFNDINPFTYLLNVESPENNLDSFYHLQIEMKPKEYFCDIEVQIFTEPIMLEFILVSLPHLSLALKKFTKSARTISFPALLLFCK